MQPSPSRLNSDRVSIAWSEGSSSFHASLYCVFAHNDHLRILALLGSVWREGLPLLGQVLARTLVKDVYDLSIQYRITKDQVLPPCICLASESNQFNQALIEITNLTQR